MSIPSWSSLRGAALAAGAGALLPLAFAPFSLYPLAVIAPAILFYLWRGASPRSAFRRGFFFGLGMFGVGVSWVYVAIHDYGFTGAPLAVLLTALFVAVLALYPAVLGWTFASLERRRPLRPAARDLLVLPALWLLFEWLRGWLFTGFPWLNLGYSLVDSPLAALAPLGGVYALSWTAVFTAGAGLYILQVRGVRALATAAAVLALWLFAGGLGGLRWSEPTGEPLRVAIVQGNLPQLTKWDAEQVQQRLQLYAALTLEHLGRADVIVWPENSVTVFYHQLAESYFAPLAAQARAAGTDLVVGLPVMERESGRYFSSMMALGRRQGVYHKRHLVPFGEFVPFESLLRGAIAFFDLPMSGFSPGPAGQEPLEVGGQRAAISICYEDAFGEEIIPAIPRSTLLINGSNNAWYGDSLAPHQHLQIARMRALESGRPLVRATTTGISALIDPRGRVGARSPQFETHVLTGEIQPQQGITPYVRWGNLPLLLWGVGWLALGVATGQARGRDAAAAKRPLPERP